MEKRVYNFSPGPAVLPLPALEEAQRDLLALPGAGISILEISHRSKQFSKIIEQAEANLRTLLAIPENYRVLFLQGGAAAIRHGPDELLAQLGQVGRLRRHRHLVEEGRPKRPRPRGPCGRPGTAKRPTTTARPQQADLKLIPAAAYVYMTSNETIQGVQFAGEPDFRRRAPGLRLVVRLPLPAGAHRPLRRAVRLRRRRTPVRRA